MKKCNICNDYKELNEFYSQKKYSKKNGEYIYFQPYCKECGKKKSKEWQLNNHDKRIETLNKYNATDKAKSHFYKFNKQYRDSGRYREWQSKNKDKLKMYHDLRMAHKKHKISKSEWEKCLNYFNNECAYCGMSQEESLSINNQVLHKEHVDYNGDNDLSNNIPACKSCNSSKSKIEFDSWYNESNNYFTKTRYEKIMNWIHGEYLKYIDDNL